MAGIDRALAAALREQLKGRDAALARGARHVGWKLGMGDRESIGGAIATGHLTSETVLSSPTYRARGGEDLHVDAEAAVELGSHVAADGGPEAVSGAIRRYGAALEIVDLAPLDGEPQSVVASNVFHRAVAFAELDEPPTADVEVLVNGESRGAARWPDDLVARLAAAARLLAAVGHTFEAGDRVITGSIVQVSVEPGDTVVADFGGRAQLSVRVETE